MKKKFKLKLGKTEEKTILENPLSKIFKEAKKRIEKEKQCRKCQENRKYSEKKQELCVTTQQSI